MARNLRLPDHIRTALRSCSFNLPASSQIDALAATESDDLHQDFFYVCPGHLKDRAFCNPVDDGAQQAANQRAEEMALEVEAVKREYAEKLKKRKDAKAEKAPEDDDKQAQQEKKDKIDAIANRKAVLPEPAAVPRVFSLHKTFYQKRLDRIKTAEFNRRTRERMASPALFPKVPGGEP